LIGGEGGTGVGDDRSTKLLCVDRAVVRVWDLVCG
jgi:hypothetical protein